MTIVPRADAFTLPLAVDDGHWMLCPVCNHNHATIVGGGVTPHPTRDAWRGVHTFGTALMEFEGECGHRWAIKAWFSKGQVHLTIEITEGDTP